MTLIHYAHPLASYCWKALIALYKNDMPFELRSVEVYFGLGPGQTPTTPAAWAAAREGTPA